MILIAIRTVILTRFALKLLAGQAGNDSDLDLLAEVIDLRQKRMFSDERLVLDLFEMENAL